MQTWIALFRGINVGGHHKLPMAELRAELESIGLRDARTYIQSGNVVFEASGRERVALADEISDLVERNHGFTARVLILDARKLGAAMEDNPFPGAVDEPKNLHLFFLESAPGSPDLAKIEEIKADSEQFELIDRVFYLHTPDGLGTSRLASSVERYLGVAATARNWRTVTKILDLASS